MTLGLQYLLPHPVDRHPIECLGHRRQRADHVELTGTPDLVQRECAVLAARPGDQGLCWLLVQLTRVQLTGAPADRRGACLLGLVAGAGLATGALSRTAPILLSAASAARSPLSQAPSTVPHSVSWVASPARNMQPTGSARIFRDGWPLGAADDIAPSANGAEFQRVALDFLIAAPASLPNSLVIHSTAKPTIGFSP